MSAGAEVFVFEHAAVTAHKTIKGRRNLGDRTDMRHL
jgi:hypothetical protein